MITLQVHDSIRQIPELLWNSLLGDEPEPYLQWAFLDALEQTGCVKPELGWASCHLGLYRDGCLIAAAPAYLKGNSEGEFVFDHSWAQFAYERLGIDYYPKLIVAVPFTPATGRRFLIAPGEDVPAAHAALRNGIDQLCAERNLSSWHILFSAGSEREQHEKAGLLTRHGLQFHWHNPGYGSFADFLSRFSSKRRNQIKRERREVSRQGLEIEAITGRELRPEMVDHVYDFYLSTVNRYFYGRQYLTRAFFEQICTTLPERVMVVLAKRAGASTPVASAFNLLGGGVLYGRYWGAREALKCLHFEVCYYRGIEESIARGLSRFEPGAGGEHKLARGFETTITHSYHRLRDPRLAAVVADFLGRESKGIARYRQQQADLLKPWRGTESPTDSQ